MNKVYVVMGGCVGDYGIYYICSSVEKAEERIKQMNNDKWGRQAEPWWEEWKVE